MDCSMPGFPIHHQLLELARTHVHWVGNQLILCRPFSSCLQSFPASGSFSSLHQVAKVLELQFQLSPFNEYSGPISFRIDWLDLLTVWRILESSTRSSKASILGPSGFFMVQLSYSYMTTGKSIALTRWTFVGKVMSLLFNMLSRLVIAFLSRSKHLLIHGCSHHLSGMVAAHLLCYFAWEVHSCFFVCFEFFVDIWNFEYYNVDLLISQGLPICDGWKLTR